MWATGFEPGYPKERILSPPHLTTLPCPHFFEVKLLKSFSSTLEAAAYTTLVGHPSTSCTATSPTGEMGTTPLHALHTILLLTIFNVPAGDRTQAPRVRTKDTTTMLQRLIEVEKKVLERVFTPGSNK